MVKTSLPEACMKLFRFIYHAYLSRIDTLYEELYFVLWPSQLLDLQCKKVTFVCILRFFMNALLIYGGFSKQYMTIYDLKKKSKSILAAVYQRYLCIFLIYKTDLIAAHFMQRKKPADSLLNTPLVDF